MADAGSGSVKLPARFESTPQAIAGAGTLTLAHGLGAAPKFVFAFLKCIGAEANYSVNDEVPISCAGYSLGSTTIRGIQCTYDATNIYVIYANVVSVFAILNKITGNAAVLTNGNWNLIIRATL